MPEPPRASICDWCSSRANTPSTRPAAIPPPIASVSWLIIPSLVDLARPLPDFRAARSALQVQRVSAIGQDLGLAPQGLVADAFRDVFQLVADRLPAEVRFLFLFA